jgi:lipoprotein Spr
VLSWQGISYKWGGRTKAGVDCSGLVQRVFRENGIQLPRSSYEQFRVGVGIPKAKLETCDLVFFNTNGSGASHVGIYLGNGQFISATKNCVEIQSLDEPYWAKTYRGSRRVIS